MAKLDTATHVHARTRIYNAIAFYYMRTDTDSALAYAHRVLKFATANRFPRGQAMSYGTLGIVSNVRDEYAESHAWHMKSLAIKRRLKDSVGIARSYGNLSFMYEDLGNYDVAIDYEFKCLQMMEATGQWKRLAPSYLNIGVNYLHQHDMEKALKYTARGFAIADSLDQDEFRKIGYNNLGLIAMEEQDYGSAKQHFKAALKLNLALEQPGLAAGQYNNLGATALEEKEYVLALEYLVKARDLYLEYDPGSGLADTYQVMGEVHAAEGRYGRAIQLLKTAVDTAQACGAKKSLVEAYRVLSETYAAAGRGDSAYATRLRYAAWRDSIFSEDKARAISEVETRYEVEKKEAAITILSQENEINTLKLAESRNYLTLAVVLGIVVLALLIVVFLSFRNFRLRTRTQSAELEQKLLRAQMNPHFIFNSLNAIQNYIYANDTRNAGNYLGRFAELMRMMLESSREELVPLTEELQGLRNYLELQKLRYEAAFEYEIELESSVENAELLVPPMLAQPFIENAVIHAFKDQQSGGMIRVLLQKKSGQLNLIVEDNGIGIDVSQSQKSSTHRPHRSMALQITKERLHLLRHRRKIAVDMDIVDLTHENKDLQGTRVRFSLPWISEWE
ncbi:MAG: tetratricopeptide repeat protein [Bacteroidota bacterium]